MRVRYSFGSRHTGKLDNITKQKVKFPVVMKKVIEVSDIVLQVLDARFVREMRNKDVDAMVREADAHSIYILNKSDLVSKAEVERTLPKGLRPFVFVSVKTGQGVKELREKIMMTAKNVELKEGHTRVQIGVVGYPNAGKSSLINRLGRRGVASTSKHAGHTKGSQKIRLSKDILLLDTPGVIPESKYTTNEKDRMSLDTVLGARTYSNVRDPEDVVHYLITAPEPKDAENVTAEEKRMIKAAEKNKKNLVKFYGFEFTDVEDLIEKLGLKMNFLKKGGKADTDRTARLILKDWQEGKIK